MARPQRITLTGDGSVKNSSPIPLNPRGNTPFNVGLGFFTDGSTTGFTVQYTFEQPERYAGPSDYNNNAVWYDHPDLAGMTAKNEGNIAFPVQAVRLQADANGSDTGTLDIIQARG